MNADILKYNSKLPTEDKLICDTLAEIITNNLKNAENKIWHGHPVWFLDGNPIVGYAKLKSSVQLLFWSGQSFDEKNLQNEGSFKAAQIRYTGVSQVNKEDLKRWLEKAALIQWDYKNIVKNKGVIVRLTK